MNTTEIVETIVFISQKLENFKVQLLLENEITEKHCCFFHLVKTDKRKLKIQELDYPTIQEKLSENDIQIHDINDRMTREFDLYLAIFPV